MPKSLRSVVFWLHLGGGILAGLFILLLATTGILMSFERQLLEWRDTYPVAAGASLHTVPAEQLAAQAAAAGNGQTLTALSIDRDPTRPVVAKFGRRNFLFLDPYHGTVLGEGATKLRGFFAYVRTLHRWLTLEGENQAIGKAITGTATLFFSLLVVSGLILWCPRRWGWNVLKRILFFQRNLKGQGRDWNWHNVIGFWACLPLLCITLSGLVMSFAWANRLLFQLAGSPPPPAAASHGGGRGGPRGASQPPGTQSPAPRSWEGLSRAIALAKAADPEWANLEIQFPPKAGEPVSVAIRKSHIGRPDLRSTLVVDLSSGKAEPLATFASQDRGRRWRMLARRLHTGELGGVAGQSIAAWSCVGAIFLVWTGFSLSWRRLQRKRKSLKAKGSKPARQVPPPSKPAPRPRPQAAAVKATPTASEAPPVSGR